MRKNVILAAILFILFIPPLVSGEEELTLSLEDCVREALKKNLIIAAEGYNPELADVSVTKAKEFFMPSLDMNYGNQHEENPSYWWIQGAETVYNKFFNYSASVVQNVPFGGNFSLSLSNYKSDTNQSFQLLNPRYGSTLRFDFAQPLLKGFGLDISKREVIMAQNNLDISEDQFISVVIDTIYLVQEAYWNLVYSIENYKVKKRSLQLAQDLLAKNRKEVEVGRLAPIEILNAETVVASREADILQAEALISKSEDALKHLLNLHEGDETAPRKIVPLDKPELIKNKISYQTAMKEALENRPDLKMKMKAMQTDELKVKVARNQMLPSLNLQLSYWSPGISGDRLIYLDDNPFLGIIIGKEKGSAADSLQDAFKFSYKNWSIGLTLSLPLSSITTKADYTRARMELEKSQLELENLEKQASLEIRDAVRDTETNLKRVEAYRLARELAEKRLEAETKKLKVGLTTNYFVLQFQEELGTALSMEIKSLVDFNLAWARLEKAMGVSLNKRNIKISRFQ